LFPLNHIHTVSSLPVKTVNIQPCTRASTVIITAALHVQSTQIRVFTSRQ
jgi:hypothetical protein